MFAACSLGGIFIGTMPDANVIIKKLREAERLAFGNSVYWVHFDEEFSDKDAVDCPEWIAPFPLFKSLAEEYDFELVFSKNSHEFVHEYMKKPEFVELMQKDSVPWVLATKIRQGQPDRTRASGSRRDQGWLYISKEDIMKSSMIYRMTNDWFENADKESAQSVEWSA